MTEAAGYRRLVANAFATFGGRVANMALALVLSTLLFRWLGASRYGIWSFFFVFVTYSSLVDLGLTTTIERSVARFQWEKNRQGIEDSLNLGIAAVLVFSTVLQVIVLALPPSWWSRFAEPADVRRLAAVLPVSLFLTNVGTVAGAGLAGIQRMGRLNTIRSAVNLLRTGAVLVLAAFGARRLDLLLLVYSSAAMVLAAASWRLLEKEVGSLRFRPLFYRPALAREFLRFGGSVQASTLAAQLGDQLFRIVLGGRFGAAAMGYYDLGNRASIVPRSLASVLLTAMLPFGTEKHLEARPGGMAKLHALALKYTSLFVLAMTGLALLFAGPVVRVWLGDSDAAVRVLTVFRVFLLVHAAGAIAGPAAMLGRAAAIPQYEAGLMVVGTATGLAAALVAPGFPQTLLAFGAITALTSIAVALVLRRRLDLAGRGPDGLVFSWTIALICLAVAALLDLVLRRAGIAGDRLRDLIRVIAASSLGLSAGFLAAWKTGLVPASEKEFWSALFRASPGASDPTDVPRPESGKVG